MTIEERLAKLEGRQRRVFWPDHLFRHASYRDVLLVNFRAQRPSTVA